MHGLRRPYVLVFKTLLEDLADVTLIDEDTKSILTDDANSEIPSNMTMNVVCHRPPGGQICKL